MATKKLTKNQAVSICYCAMILADGKVDPNELAWAHESPIASKYEVDKNRKWISEILQEGGNLSEYTAQLPTPELKRMTVDERNAITGDLMILSAIDGKADEKELKLLYPTYLLLGGNDEDFNAFMQKMQDAMEKNRSGGGCFIATATMGNYDHPVVMDLRTFRDETLKRSIAGRIFIYFYYKIGPLFASIIEQSRTLRNLSFKFLIKPLHSLVSKK
tara:strand:+ start:38 stop:688 length:651 start_codon:yes stop_codon:yes gene_type:complete